MRWPGHVAADTIRAYWVRAQWQFSPLAGWPPPWRGELPMDLAGLHVDLAEIAVALSVVSSSPPLWEAQALIIDYCSSREGDPAPQWAALTRTEPSGAGGQVLDDIISFIADVPPQVRYPYPALESAGQIMSQAFRPATLDGLGYLVARLDDWDECRVICENAADPYDCLENCLARTLG